MTKVLWTEPALHDLERIQKYCNGLSPKFAKRIVEKILNQVERLTKFPLSGRVVPEVEIENIREVIVSQYRIIYWVDEEAQMVDILTVFHSSRQFGKST